MTFKAEELLGGFRIGECVVEPRKNVIVRGNSEAHVEPRVMDVLVCLAEHAGEVVSRDALNQRVWANVVVTDQAVTNCISELRQHLGDDRSTNRVIETIPKRGYRLAAPVQLFPLPAAETLAPAKDVPPLRRHALLITVVAILVALLGFTWWHGRASSPVLSSVAVLRFENASGDESLDYLGLALPDEIATLLTRSSGVAVRPLGYVDVRDPLAGARARHVDNIVSGRYYLEAPDQLSLAIEAQDVMQERVVWRTRISVPVSDLLVMRGRISEGVRGGLLPALGARAVAASASIPTDGEAYQLYLRSLAIPHQPDHGARAIEMLEHAVKLEPSFAPAWDALGVRYYDYGTWWGGEAPARQRSVAAHRRAVELDPQLLGAAQRLVTRRVEDADLEGAYREARRLLKQFGSTAETHFAISYVHRYGGDFEGAQRHCDLALARDPRDPGLRSCAYAFLYAGDLSRVMDYLKLDQGSYFVNWGTVLYNLRTGDHAAALRAAQRAVDDETRRLVEPCLQGARGGALDDAVRAFVGHWEKAGDPETPYAVAPMLLACDRPREALRFLERSVDMTFCSYPAVDLDPVWIPLRNDADFQRIRGKARACHDRYRSMVEAVDAESA